MVEDSSEGYFAASTRLRRLFDALLSEPEAAVVRSRLFWEATSHLRFLGVVNPDRKGWNLRLEIHPSDAVPLFPAMEGGVFNLLDDEPLLLSSEERELSLEPAMGSVVRFTSRWTARARVPTRTVAVLIAEGAG